jgi:hypothetical protein
VIADVGLPRFKGCSAAEFLTLGDGAPCLVLSP